MNGPFPRHGLPGYFSLYDVPQRGPLAEMVYSTGWVEMDDIFKLYPGQFVVVTGKPGSGKSTFWLNLLCQLSWKHKKKHMLFVPENEGAIIDKMELIYGQSLVQFSAFAHSQCFIQSSYDEHYDAEPRTIEWMLDRAWNAWKSDGIDTVTIDPWNELEQARQNGEMMTDYVGRCLRLVKRFARETGVTFCIIAHPSKVSNDRDTQLGDIEGSQHWWNKADAGIIVNREAGKTDSRVVVAKVREQPVAGRPGQCIFQVENSTGIFREQHGGGVVF
jgi:twinkle protein